MVRAYEELVDVVFIKSTRLACWNGSMESWKNWAVILRAASFCCNTTYWRFWWYFHRPTWIFCRIYELLPFARPIYFGLAHCLDFHNVADQWRNGPFTQVRHNLSWRLGWMGTERHPKLPGVLRPTCPPPVLPPLLTKVRAASTWLFVS